MRALAILGLCAACAMAGERAKVVDGKEVIGGPSFMAEPLLVVSDLRFYDCTLAKDGTHCTVATGTLLSRIPNQMFSVKVSIDMYQMVKNQRFGNFRGSIEVVVDRPKPNTPTKFAGVGAAWRTNEEADVTAYVVRTALVTPSHMEPPKVDEPPAPGP